VLGVSGVCDVISSDFEVFGRDKEEDIIMFAHDFDISFITGAYGVYGSFIAQVKGMAIESCGCGIVEDGLIRDFDVKDTTEYGGGLSGSDGKRHIKGEDKAEDVSGIVNFREINFRVIRLGMIKFAGFIMILPVLVTELELRAAFFLKQAFSVIKLIKRLYAMTAIIVGAFIDGDIFTIFPFKQSAVAVRAEEPGFIVFAESLV
jgi:hypothetical protein